MKKLILSIISSVKSLFWFLILSFILVSPLFYISCTNDNVEELFPIDSVSNVSYNEDVKPILELNCYACHSGSTPTAGFTLETYEDVVIYVENGKLFGAINHENGYNPMPQSAAKLPDQQIEIIKQWIEEGYPNN